MSHDNDAAAEQTFAIEPVDPNSLEGRILALLHEGKKIDAVKLVRQERGMGLAEAKLAVEAVAAKHHIESASGCGVGAVVIGAILIGIVFGVVMALR